MDGGCDPREQGPVVGVADDEAVGLLTVAEWLFADRTP
jgi:hypothetical protein